MQCTLRALTAAARAPQHATPRQQISASCCPLRKKRACSVATGRARCRRIKDSLRSAAPRRQELVARALMLGARGRAEAAKDHAREMLIALDGVDHRPERNL